MEEEKMLKMFESVIDKKLADMQNKMAQQTQPAQHNNVEEKDVDIVQKKLLEEKVRKSEMETELKKRTDEAVFLQTIQSHVDTNSAFLPENAKRIVELCIENYDTNSEKVAAIKKELSENFFGIQDNLDKLSPVNKNKVTEFLSSTISAKLNKAPEIYSIMEEAINYKKIIAADMERKNQKYNEINATRDKVFEKNNTYARDVLLGKIKPER